MKLHEPRPPHIHMKSYSFVFTFPCCPPIWLPSPASFHMKQAYWLENKVMLILRNSSFTVESNEKSPSRRSSHAEIFVSEGNASKIPLRGERDTSRIPSFFLTILPHLMAPSSRESNQNRSRIPEQARCMLTDDSSSSVWGRVSLHSPSLTISRLSRPRCHVGAFKCCNSIQLYLYGVGVTIKRAHGLQEHGRAELCNLSALLILKFIHKNKTPEDMLGLQKAWNRSRGENGDTRVVLESVSGDVMCGKWKPHTLNIFPDEQKRLHPILSGWGSHTSDICARREVQRNPKFTIFVSGFGQMGFGGRFGVSNSSPTCWI